MAFCLLLGRFTVRIMRVGFLQFAPKFGEKEWNVKRIEEFLAQKDADLWVLPELCTTGYQFTKKSELLELAEPVARGPSIQALLRFAREKHTYLVLGFAERDGENLYNSAAVLGPEGVLGVYRKVHLFFQERHWFSPGNLPFSVVKIKGVPVGVMICYDHMFPEAARVLALKGAWILAHPANFVLPGLGQLTMRVRALENRVFAVTANRVGTEARAEPALTFTGMSQIVSPKGEILATAGKETEEAVVVEINPAEAEDKYLTPLNHIFRDRRPEFYRELLEG